MRHDQLDAVRFGDVGDTGVVGRVRHGDVGYEELAGGHADEPLALQRDAGPVLGREHLAVLGPVQGARGNIDVGDAENRQRFRW